MKSLTRWNPIDELRTTQHQMDRLFNRFLGLERGSESGVGLWMPAIESYEKDGQLFFRAELPGVDPKEIDISIADRELVIKGERKQEKDTKEENYQFREISYGSFERHFELPEGTKTEELKAKFNNGIPRNHGPLDGSRKAQKDRDRNNKRRAEKTRYRGKESSVTSINHADSCFGYL